MSNSSKSIDTKKRVLEEKNDNIPKNKVLNNVNGENIDGDSDNSKLLASQKQYAPCTGKDIATQTNFMLTNAETQTTDGEKVATTTSANKKGKYGKETKKCVEECLPGESSDCAKRNGRQWGGQLQCTDVYDELRRLGVTEFEGLSKCLLSGMLSGYVKVPVGGDLDTVLYEFQDSHEGACRGHNHNVTLRMLLYQEDEPDSLDGGPVTCDAFVDGDKGCPCGVFLSQLCSGKPRLEAHGKFHNHCTQCPGFGRCLGDYRNECRIDKKTGEHYAPRFVGASGIYTSDEEDSDENSEDDRSDSDDDE